VADWPQFLGWDVAEMRIVTGDTFIPFIRHACGLALQMGYDRMGKRMPAVIGQQRVARNQARAKSRPSSRAAAEFPAGSLEAELSAIGKSAPAREWARVPADYFANLDNYLHPTTKKK
jgi:hypothetical protein